MVSALVLTNGRRRLSCYGTCVSSVYISPFATLWCRTCSRSIACGHNDRPSEGPKDGGRLRQLVLFNLCSSLISSFPKQNPSLRVCLRGALIMRESNKPFKGSCRTFICAKTTSGLYLYISSRNPKRSLFLHDRNDILNTPIVTRFRFVRCEGTNSGDKGSATHFQQ
jgi:hypothetical protein